MLYYVHKDGVIVQELGLFSDADSAINASCEYAAEKDEGYEIAKIGFHTWFDGSFKLYQVGQKDDHGYLVGFSEMYFDKETAQNIVDDHNESYAKSGRTNLGWYVPYGLITHEDITAQRPYHKYFFQSARNPIEWTGQYLGTDYVWLSQELYQDYFISITRAVEKNEPPVYKMAVAHTDYPMMMYDSLEKAKREAPKYFMDAMQHIERDDLPEWDDWMTWLDEYGRKENEC